MRKLLAVAVICFTLTGLSKQAFAQQEGIGVGAMLNSPTGFSLKGWVNDEIAVDGALSFSIASNNSSIYIHADVLYHGDYINEDIEVNTGTLQAYLGGGFRLWWFDRLGDPIIGLRAPLGMNYNFENTKTETFFELVPTLDFNPSVQFSFAGAIGFRYYLN